MKDSAMLTLEVSRKSKANWVMIARRYGGLRNWVEATLNAAAEPILDKIREDLAENPPRWMKDLSYQMRLSLIHYRWTEQQWLDALASWTEQQWHKQFPHLEKDTYQEEIVELQREYRALKARGR